MTKRRLLLLAEAVRFLDAETLGEDFASLLEGETGSLGVKEPAERGSEGAEASCQSKNAVSESERGSDDEDGP